MRDEDLAADLDMSSFKIASENWHCSENGFRIQWVVDGSKFSIKFGTFIFVRCNIRGLTDGSELVRMIFEKGGDGPLGSIKAAGVTSLEAQECATNTSLRAQEQQ